MEDPHVLYRVEGHIAIITLNRPEFKNAFSPEMIILWRQFLEEARTDRNVRVIILTGTAIASAPGRTYEMRGRKTEIMGDEEVPVGRDPSDSPDARRPG